VERMWISDVFDVDKVWITKKAIKSVKKLSTVPFQISTFSAWISTGYPQVIHNPILTKMKIYSLFFKWLKINKKVIHNFLIPLLLLLP
jgi:hypothetical protein